MSTLLVTVDALRADHLAQYGYHRDTMPALDTLTDSGGTRFDAVFANGTNTGISLPSLLTSRYRGDKYVKNGPTVASPLEVTTGAIHSNTFFASKHDQAHGFDQFDDFGITDSVDNSASATHQLFRRVMDRIRPTVNRLGIRSTAEKIQEFIFPAQLIHEATVYESAKKTTDRALNWIQAVDDEFFLWVHYMDPHRPYGVDLEDPEYGASAAEDEIQDLMSLAGVSPGDVTKEQRKRIVDLYDSDIRYTSEHVDRLFEGIQSLGDWEETDIILTADHGEEFADHGYYFHRNRPYDELLHVPLAIKSDHKSDTVVEYQRELLDVAPTICDLQGVEPPSSFLGRNLFEGDDREVISMGAFSESGPVVAARWDGYKYITTGDQEELYDLEEDRDEHYDVSDDSTTCQIYRNRIPDTLLEGHGKGVPDASDVDDDVADRLEKLGYMD